MIRVLLQGRTGNNLFQYAAGRALAIRHHTTLELDFSWAGADAAQIRQLERLPIQARIARSWSPLKKGIRRLTGKGPELWHHGPIYQDRGSDSGFDPQVLNLPNHTLLTGFFQNEGYFLSIAASIRRELSLDAIKLPAASATTCDLIHSHPMASLHIRRGDYLNIPATRCVPADYHTKACHYLQERFENLRFLVFSDDIAWCRKEFIGSQFHFCDHPESAADPFHDLKLIAACQHHIIMNSSYSWWGAWLNPSQDKTIVAPKMWMTNTHAHSVIPSSWILM